MEEFISYAQNYEDVILWRALKHIHHGFYVDVGANDPKIDSITQAFYERGWRGINIEPVQTYYQSLCQERPEDINLPIAAGSSEGETNFFEVPDTSLSSIVSLNTQSIQSAGYTVLERRIHVMPLNRILEKYAHDPIHFLKIDIEGFEGKVLEGLDLSLWHPWIIVIEATKQNTPEPNYVAWEHQILSADYTFVFFNGLNRFYISNKHTELVPAFSTPPNIFDHFISYQQLLAINEIEHKNLALQKQQESLLAFQKEFDIKNSFIQKQQELLLALQKDLDSKQKDLEAEKRELQVLRYELDWVRNELGYFRIEIGKTRDEREVFRQTNESTQAELNSKRLEADDLRKENESIRAELNSRYVEADNLRKENESIQIELNTKRFEAENFRKEYVNIYASQSYRITSPLRWASRLLRRPKEKDKLPIKSSVADSESKLPEKEHNVEPVRSEDELHFLNLFQHEIEKRRNL